MRKGKQGTIAYLVVSVRKVGVRHDDRVARIGVLYERERSISRANGKSDGKSRKRRSNWTHGVRELKVRLRERPSARNRLSLGDSVLGVVDLEETLEVGNVGVGEDFGNDVVFAESLHRFSGCRSHCQASK